MAFCVAAAAFFLCLSFWSAQSKVYDRCELAHELRDVHEIPEHQLATWLCITNYESHYNTSAHNPGSGDHGLFQISELYWCSPPGVGLSCGVTCSALKDDDIEDDVICARRIYRQHQRISGDGFTAWVVYNLHCRNPVHVASFLDGCFDYENLVKYGYQPAAMNLPTMMVPMPTSPSPSAPSGPPKVTPKSTEGKQVSAKPTTPMPAMKVSNEMPPRVQVSSSVKPSVSEAVQVSSPTTPNPPLKVSTYKPVDQLSSMVTSITSVQTSSPEQMSSTFKTSPTASVMPTTPKPSMGMSSSISTSLKSSTPEVMDVSIVFNSSPAAGVTSTSKPVMRVSNYTPLLESSPMTSVKPTTSPSPATPKPSLRISTHRPQSSSPVSSKSSTTSTHRTSPASIKPTTPKPHTKASTYKPLLNRFGSVSETSPKSSSGLMTSRQGQPIHNVSQYKTSATPKPTTKAAVTKHPMVMSTMRPSSVKKFSSTSSQRANPRPSTRFSSASTPVTPKSPLFDGNNAFSKANPVKPRQTKYNVKPFKFRPDEKVYALINDSGYSYAISSRGFKLVWTGQ